MDDSKVDANLRWPIPCSMKQLHIFLGMASVYCKVYERLRFFFP